MRRGLRLVPLALLLAVVIEIVVFVLVGHAIGFGWTILLVLAASVLGLLLLRREGMRAWRGFRSAAEAGAPPGRQVVDGLVGLGAGLLLAVPGLVSGVVGLLLVVPPVRRLAARGVRVATERRVSAMVAGDLFGPRRVRVRRGAPQPPTPPAADSRPPPATGPAIEGEIVDHRPN
ncbi:FxsA family protein [Micromonospora sp. NBC_01699]|uniref:FxsA family protein n=1 Tax=Micromonospora sp. NBC_01699 TaxID=2975984 RepID=UPI002E3812B7|nr:FxsA family protein [Micromonospora sp. NBC_01699]